MIEPSGSVKRKINNVWGAVLTEQTLTQDLKDVGVYKNPELKKSDRNVERYDFTNAYDDDRPDAIDIAPVESNDPFENVIVSDHEDDSQHKRGSKRKRKMKHRLGKKNSVKDRLNMPMKVKASNEFEEIGVSVESSEDDVVTAIATELFEPKTELIGKVLFDIYK